MCTLAYNLVSVIFDARIKQGISIIIIIMYIAVTDKRIMHNTRSLL